MTETPAPTYCANHPTVETSLRCYRCGKPICARCANRTPTGYLCPECVRGQRKTFETAVWSDFVLGGITAGGLGFVASLLASLVTGLGFIGWILVFVGASSAGVMIAEAVRYVTRKHRSRPLFITVAAAVAVGALPVILFQVFSLSFFSLIFQGIFLFIAIPIVYTRLSGIQLTR